MGSDLGDLHDPGARNLARRAPRASAVQLDGFGVFPVVANASRTSRVVASAGPNKAASFLARPGFGGASVHVITGEDSECLPQRPAPGVSVGGSGAAAEGAARFLPPAVGPGTARTGQHHGREHRTTASSDCDNNPSTTEGAGRALLSRLINARSTAASTAGTRSHHQDTPSSTASFGGGQGSQILESLLPSPLLPTTGGGGAGQSAGSFRGRCGASTAGGRNAHVLAGGGGIRSGTVNGIDVPGPFSKSAAAAKDGGGAASPVTDAAPSSSPIMARFFPGSSRAKVVPEGGRASQRSVGAPSRPITVNLNELFPQGGGGGGGGIRWSAADEQQQLLQQEQRPQSTTRDSQQPPQPPPEQRQSATRGGGLRRDPEASVRVGSLEGSVQGGALGGRRVRMTDPTAPPIRPSSMTSHLRSLCVILVDPLRAVLPTAAPSLFVGMLHWRFRRAGLLHHPHLLADSSPPTRRIFTHHISPQRVAHDSQGHRHLLPRGPWSSPPPDCCWARAAAIEQHAINGSRRQQQEPVRARK